MAGRIRTVKPEWLEDELLLLASPAARVLSIALILLADDYGNGRANATLLVSRIFPGHSREGQEAFEELLDMGYFRCYKVRGQNYFTIRNWARHQRVDKPGKPRVPGPEEADENIRETSGNLPESPAPDPTTTTTTTEDRERESIRETRGTDAVRSLADQIWQEQEELRQLLKLEGIGTETRGLGLTSPAKLVLMDRISEALAQGATLDDAREDCRHVLSVLGAEARAQRSLKWLNGGHWEPKRYATAMTLAVGETFRSTEPDGASVSAILGAKV